MLMANPEMEKLLASLDNDLPRSELFKKKVPALAKAACWEADTNYPVPRYMSPQICASILRRVLPRDTQRRAPQRPRRRVRPA